MWWIISGGDSEGILGLVNIGAREDNAGCLVDERKIQGLLSGSASALSEIWK